MYFTMGTVCVKWKSGIPIFGGHMKTRMENVKTEFAVHRDLFDWGTEDTAF